MRTVGSSTNGDYDLTTSGGISVYNQTPNASHPLRVYAHIELGDGTKNLTSTGGDFLFEILVGGVAIDGGQMTKTLGTETRAVVQTDEFLVPANKSVQIKIESPNADSDVDVTTQLYDSTPVQQTTGSLGNPVSVASNNLIYSDTLRISSDQTAADNLEAMLDGTGATLTLSNTLDVNATQIEGTDASDVIKTQADAALTDIRLDHLMAASALSAGDQPVQDSIIAQMVSKDVTPQWTDFNNTTDSLQAIRDRGDSDWLTATGFNTQTPLDAAGIRSAVGLASANLDTQLSTIDTVVDTILVDTNELQTNQGNWLTATGFNTQTPLDAAGIRAAVGLSSANLDTQLSTIDTVVDSILVDTDELQTNQNNWLTATGFSTHAAADVWSVATRELSAATNITSDGTSITMSSAGVVGTVNTVNTTTTVTNQHTLDEIADAVHDEIYEGTMTLRQGLRLMSSALFGKASGMDTTTATFRDIGDTKDRITATVDADGNRSAVTTDAT